MIAEMKLFKKISDEINSGVYDFTDNGKCMQCGACCSNYLPMTQAEIATIHRFMKKHGIKEFKHLFPVSGDAYDMTCPFMDDSERKEKCRIYPVRPEICRQFICKGDKKPFRMKATRYEVVDVRKEFFGE